MLNRSIFMSILLTAGISHAADFTTTKKDSECPSGKRLAEIAEVEKHKTAACSKLGAWEILRLGGGGSLGGSGYKCEIIKKDDRKLGGSVCVTATETAPTKGFAPALAAAGPLDFSTTKQDSQCPAGKRLAEIPEVEKDKNAACKKLGAWEILRLAGGGSLGGSGYKCEIIKKDTRKLGGSVCVTGNTPAAAPEVKTAAAAPAFEGWYRLKTMFRGEGECLEGNQRASQVAGGAAFMDSCQNVSGQLWKFVPAPEAPGWYRLKTQFRGEGECLEGNQRTSQVHGGAAFMDKCQNVSGQLWQPIPDQSGWYRLKTQFRGEGECLEGNQRASQGYGGAAFMDNCQNVSGQLFQFVKQ